MYVVWISATSRISSCGLRIRCRAQKQRRPLPERPGRGLCAIICQLSLVGRPPRSRGIQETQVRIGGDDRHSRHGVQGYQHCVVVKWLCRTSPKKPGGRGSGGDCSIRSQPCQPRALVEGPAAGPGGCRQRAALLPNRAPAARGHTRHWAWCGDNDLEDEAERDLGVGRGSQGPRASPSATPV
jgi:hypothetical protein